MNGLTPPICKSTGRAKGASEQGSTLVRLSPFRTARQPGQERQVWVGGSQTDQGAHLEASDHIVRSALLRV